MSNWRWWIGSRLGALENRLLSSRLLPLLRWVPRGRHFTYDLQRFFGTRKLPVLFDVGANVGQTAGHLLQYFPDSQIVCFEPAQTPFAQLQRRFAGRANVHCEPLALGHLAGSSSMRLNQNSELNTLTPLAGPEDDGAAREDVRVETLDGYCARHGLTRIDLLKMDVQGWEMQVLRGAEAMLAAGAIRSIYSEVAFRSSDREMQDFAELNGFLEQQGFWLAGFYECFRWGEARQFLGFANVLYLRREPESETASSR